MVANGYVLEQAINEGLAIFCSFISLLQIRAASLAENPGKKRIHLCGALVLALWILANIDPQGVYGKMPRVLVNLFTQWSLDGISAGLCFIIWSHFQVHYSSLNRDMPKFLRPSLVAGVVWLVTISTILHIYENFNSIYIFEVLDSLTNLIFIGLIFLSDLYGYYLIKKVFKELHRAILETTPQTGARERTSMIDHQKNTTKNFSFSYMYINFVNH